MDSVGTKQHFADALGSVTRITDSTGTRYKLMVYDSYGNMTSDTGSVQADYVSYTGREAERNLGIYYYRARYYDPLTGRFMSRDPLGFAAGDVNLYRYVGNNPVSLRDPLGLYWGQDYIEAVELYLRWYGGVGPTHYNFGPNSVWARNMMDARGVTMARYQWYVENYATLRNGSGGSLRST